MMEEFVSPPVQESPSPESPAAADPAGPDTPPETSGQAAPSETSGAAPWWQALPEGLRKDASAFASQEEAVQALQRGATYRPASRAEDIRIHFPEGVEIDEATHADFKSLCVQSGITPDQAQALADWQIRANSRNLQQVIEKGETTLRHSWGGDFDRNRQAALQALTTLDRRMEGRLAPALARVGGANVPEVLEALHLVSTLIGEDSLGAAAPGGGSGEERPEDAYGTLFK